MKNPKPKTQNPRWMFGFTPLEITRPQGPSGAQARARFLTGFTIIETTIALLLIIVTVTIFGVALSSLPLTKTARNQNIAYHIAAKKMEELRDTQFASLPAGSSFTDPVLLNLNGAQASFTLEDYQGSSQIKTATVTVQWQEESRTRDVVLETLISDKGLNRP